MMEHHQKHKITKMQKGAKSIFPIDKENAYILQRKKEEGKSVHRGCASPAFSISYGQAKEMATHKGSHLPMYQALASISGDDQIFRAIVECIIFHFTPLGDGDAHEVGTMRESIIPNLLY